MKQYVYLGLELVKICHDDFEFEDLIQEVIKLGINPNDLDIRSY